MRELSQSIENILLYSSKGQDLPCLAALTAVFLLRLQQDVKYSIRVSCG